LTVPLLPGGFGAADASPARNVTIARSVTSMEQPALLPKKAAISDESHMKGYGSAMDMPGHPTQPLLVGILWSAPGRPSIPMAGPAAGATPEIRGFGAPPATQHARGSGIGSTAEASVAPRRKNAIHRRVVTSPLALVAGSRSYPNRSLRGRPRSMNG
jgi:hypothetical protein